jgi:hypothetical protein
MAQMRVPDDGPIIVPEGEFAICTGCRKPIDPNDSATIRAHSTADCERASREPDWPLELHFFHPNHYPGRKRWRLASVRKTEPYMPVERVTLPLAAQFQLASLFTEQDAPGADWQAVKAKAMAWVEASTLTTAELAEFTMQLVEHKARRDNGDPDLTIVGTGSVSGDWVLRSSGGMLGWLPQA